jgi:hypothetical protein
MLASKCVNDPACGIMSIFWLSAVSNTGCSAWASEVAFTSALTAGCIVLKNTCNHHDPSAVELRGMSGQVQSLELAAIWVLQPP